jgi:hypothetical protein
VLSGKSKKPWASHHISMNPFSSFVKPEVTLVELTDLWSGSKEIKHMKGMNELKNIIVI